MRFIYFAILLSLPLYGQTADDLFNPPPPEVEQALRERVNLFYQSHMSGQFRKADTVVHEDSKDIFFAAEKIQFKKCDISKFSFESNFTKAKVVTGCNFTYLMPTGRADVIAPFSTLWKLEDGKWWWYVVPFDPKKGVETPFGIMKPTDTPDQREKEMVTSYGQGERVFKGLKLSKDTVLMPVHTKSTQEVTLTSTFLGTVNLSLVPIQSLGLEIKLDKTQLVAGETAKISITYDPPAPIKMLDVKTTVVVEPFGLKLPLTITFADR